MANRRKEIERHLTEAELDAKAREAAEEQHLRRIGFVKNLYRGDTIAEAAEREGRSESTGNRWADAWNEGGLKGLMPDFGGGRPPKLNEAERDELIKLLSDGQPWNESDIYRLLREEFGVEYHPDYLGTFLRGLGLTHVESRSTRPARSGTATDITAKGVDGPVDATHPEDRRDDDGGGWIVGNDV